MKPHEKATRTRKKWEAEERRIRANQIISHGTDGMHAATQWTEVTVYAFTRLHHQRYYGVGSCAGLTVYWVRYRIIRPSWNWNKQLPCLHAHRSGCSLHRLAEFRSYCATLIARPRTLQRQQVLWAFWPRVVLPSNRRSTGHIKVVSPPLTPLKVQNKE